MGEERAITAGGRTFRYREEGTGEGLLWLGGGTAWSRAHALMAARHRVVTLDPSGPAGAVADAAEALGIARFDLVGQGAAAGAALRLALERPQAVRAVVLLGPTLLARDGTAAAADAALVGRLGELALPSLALFGTTDAHVPVEAARHYRQPMPSCNLVFVYDAGQAMAEERPEAVSSLVLDFLERHDLFLVRRESDLIHP
jgi:pimeloyl-ACP methyl ester carboxylesterase